METSQTDYELEEDLYYKNLDLYEDSYGNARLKDSIRQNKGAIILMLTEYKNQSGKNLYEWEKSSKCFWIVNYSRDFKIRFSWIWKSIISFIDSRAKNGSNKDVDTYILFLVYQFYKEHKNLVAKDKIYQDNEVVIQISQGGGKFGDIKITMGMLYFYQEFVTNRLFNVKKSTRYELSDLINKKNLSDDEEERKELLLEEVQERVLKAKGLKDILMRSNGSMESFRGILLKSMQQFFLEIPSDNTVLDKEWKRL